MSPACKALWPHHSACTADRRQGGLCMAAAAHECAVQREGRRTHPGGGPVIFQCGHALLQLQLVGAVQHAKEAHAQQLQRLDLGAGAQALGQADQVGSLPDALLGYPQNPQSILLLGGGSLEAGLAASPSSGCIRSEGLAQHVHALVLGRPRCSPCTPTIRSMANTSSQAPMVSRLQGGAPGGGCCSLGTLLLPGSSPGTVIAPGDSAAYRT